MSRIGIKPIELTDGTRLTEQPDSFLVVGSKGELVVPKFNGVSVEQAGTILTVKIADPTAKNFFGLQRSLLANAVQGVSQGWTQQLELQGVGIRASLAGTSLSLSLGFSHTITVNPPEGITFSVTKNLILVSGIDKQLVGETAAKIRSLRPPEPYKGKGIRYSGEYVRRKAGKTAKAAAK